MLCVGSLSSSVLQKSRDFVPLPSKICFSGIRYYISAQKCISCDINEGLYHIITYQIVCFCSVCFEGLRGASSSNILPFSLLLNAMKLGGKQQLSVKRI